MIDALVTQTECAKVVKEQVAGCGTLVNQLSIIIVLLVAMIALLFWVTKMYRQDVKYWRKAYDNARAKTKNKG